MRELIAAKNLVLELKHQTNLELNGVGIVSKAWEDNICTHNLANKKGPLLSARLNTTGLDHRSS